MIAVPLRAEYRTTLNLPRNAQLWLPAYLRDRARRLTSARPPKRVWISFCDHFEPCGNTTLPNAHKRMAAWRQQWPEIAAAAPLDSEGRPPCYTFFYPQEEYNREILNTVTEITQTGFAEVEVHLHHFDDTAPSFVQKVRDFTACLHNDHGHLHIHDGKLVFGFIHGNWALDNSRPDGKACGVTGELQLLRDLGCYADFTMPSCPSPTQSRIVNQIYWTTGDQAKPKGFDSGIEATLGGGRRGDILMVEGPLGLRFKGRLKPRIETGELASYDPPHPDRIPLWLSLAPRLGDDVFIKLFGHSAREDNAAALIGTPGKAGALGPMFRWIHEYTQQHKIELHWASAYRMYCAIEALVQPAPLA